MVKRFISISVCLMALVALPFIVGCGSGSKEGSARVTVEEPALAGVAACTNCHPIQTSDWKDGGHTNRNDLPSYAMIGAVGSSECRECHDPNNEGSSMNEVLGGTYNARPVNGCETCHGNGGNHFGLGPITKYRVAKSGFASSQFMTCNACHRLRDKTTGALMAPGQHATDNIQMNHVATPGDWSNSNGTNKNAITGVSIDPLNNHACSNCHNPHKADLTINKDWYNSGHAARESDGPWAYYNWSAMPGCQKCHTTSGFAAFATKNEAGQMYVAATDAPLKADTNWKPEMITCIGCHTTNYDGGRRNPKAITADYNFNGVRATFPGEFSSINPGDSNICITCHEGRESGESLNAVTDFSNWSFIDAHYLAVAGLMYAKSGFTGFTDASTPVFFNDAVGTYGQSLTSDTDGGLLTSTHRKLGTPALVGDINNPAAFTRGNYDSMGPCVTCHMQAAGQARRKTSHTLSIDFNAAKEVCINCHAGEVDNAGMLSSFLEGQSGVFQDALNLAVGQLLSRQGISYSDEYPYFFDERLPLVAGSKQAVTDWTRGTNNQAFGKKVMGAAFNISLLKHEPAAYAHARTYARRLLYDTIDFLDDGTINLSVSATAVAANPAKYVKGTGSANSSAAFNYLVKFKGAGGSFDRTKERP